MLGAITAVSNLYKNNPGSNDVIIVSHSLYCVSLYLTICLCLTAVNYAISIETLVFFTIFRSFH